MLIFSMYVHDKKRQLFGLVHKKRKVEKVQERKQ